jgi:hypothetical protein
MTHHNQTMELTTWFLIDSPELQGYRVFLDTRVSLRLSQA